MKDYSEILTEIYNECQSCDTSSPNVTINSLSSIITKLTCFINDFLYNSQYINRNQISYVYNVVRENKFPNKTVCCVDVRKATEIYGEYLSGMIEFVSDIVKNANLNCDNIEDSSVYDESLKKAYAKDKDFILSLFNDEKCEEKNLNDALYDFEYIIDFINVCKRFVDNASTVINGIDYNRSDMCISSDLIQRSVKLMYNSITEFAHTAIRNMIGTYEKILKSIETEDKPVVKLQLF